MKQVVMLGRPIWQGTEGSHWQTTVRNKILPTTLCISMEVNFSTFEPSDDYSPGNALTETYEREYPSKPCSDPLLTETLR